MDKGEQLTIEERLELLELISESLAEHESELELSPQQLALARRRIEAYRADPRPGTPVAKVVDEIRSDRK